MKGFLALALFLLLPTTAMAADEDCGIGLSQGGQISNRLWPVKGGIAIIGTNLYVVVNGANNKLLLDDGKSWTGQARRQPEVVVYFQGKVWPKDGLPKDFDMRQAIVISFEADVVRFFDFGEQEGGCYPRGQPLPHQT